MYSQLGKLNPIIALGGGGGGGGAKHRRVWFAMALLGTGRFAVILLDTGGYGPSSHAELLIAVLSQNKFGTK